MTSVQTHLLLQDALLLRLGHIGRAIEAGLQGDLMQLIAKHTWQLVSCPPWKVD